MDAVGPSGLMVTIIMVSVRPASSLSMGSSLPRSRMLVVPLGTSNVGTAVGMGTTGVGSPSRKKPTATVASKVGSNMGRLVGEGVTVGSDVGVLVGVLSGSFVTSGSSLAGRGVWVGSGISVGGNSVGVEDGRFAKAAAVGVGSGATLPQAASNKMSRIRNIGQ